jgi:CheY-like chemotaxis protein
MKTITMANQTYPYVQSGSRTVLVVDDEEMVRLPISEYLRDCGYTVLEAGDAQEAVAAIDTEPSVDVVFSDVRMPGRMDGLGLAKWLRTHHPQISVILTSGYNAGRLSPDSIPGVRFIEKPYSQVQVERRIAALIETGTGEAYPVRLTSRT